MKSKVLTFLGGMATLLMGVGLVYADGGAELPPSNVPEPCTILSLAMGLAGMVSAGLIRRCKK
jgi:hypothetical protein